MQHHLVKIIASDEDLKRIGIYENTRKILTTPNLVFRGYIHKTTNQDVTFYLADDKLHDGHLWVKYSMVKKIEECK